MIYLLFVKCLSIEIEFTKNTLNTINATSVKRDFEIAQTQSTARCTVAQRVGHCIVCHSSMYGMTQSRISVLKVSTRLSLQSTSISMSDLPLQSYRFSDTDLHLWHRENDSTKKTFKTIIRPSFHDIGLYCDCFTENVLLILVSTLFVFPCKFP